MYGAGSATFPYVCRLSFYFMDQPSPLYRVRVCSNATLPTFTKSWLADIVLILATECDITELLLHVNPSARILQQLRNARDTSATRQQTFPAMGVGKLSEPHYLLTRG